MSGKKHVPGETTGPIPLTTAEFAVAYADQNQCDYQALVDAVKAKRVKAQTGV